MMDNVKMEDLNEIKTKICEDIFLRFFASVIFIHQVKLNEKTFGIVKIFSSQESKI